MKRRFLKTAEKPMRVYLRANYKKDIPRSVREQLAQLERKDNWHNIFYIGFDWLVIVVAVALALGLHFNPLAYVIAVLAIGSRQRALMNLLHEASHNKLFRNRRANDWLGAVLTAYPMGASFTAYKAEHYIHHGYLWDETRDPKTKRYKELGLLPPPSDRTTFYSQHVVKPLMLAHVPHNVSVALSTKGEQTVESGIRFGLLGVVLGGLVAINQLVYGHALLDFILLWLVPFCTSFQVIRYWNEMAEHAGLQDQEDNPWMATRNWKSSGIIQWILAPHSDDLYHLTHHLFPLIPHYRLEEAHRLLLTVPQYAQGHHCDGFFLPHSADAPSVFQDIRHPDNIHNYRHVADGRTSTEPV